MVVVIAVVMMVMVRAVSMVMVVGDAAGERRCGQRKRAQGYQAFHGIFSFRPF